MKRLLLSFLIATAATQAFAQGNATVTAAANETPATGTDAAVHASNTNVQPFRFGYFSYQKTFEAMPDHVIAQRNIEDLKAKYDKEMKRVEEEFNQKYELFLDGQRDFAPSIRHKRQAELQELMEKNMAFKAEAQRLLKEAQDNAYKPLRDKIAAALQKVGKEKGLAFILNTDNNAAPFIDPTTGFDVQADVDAALR